MNHDDTHRQREAYREHKGPPTQHEIDADNRRRMAEIDQHLEPEPVVVTPAEFEAIRAAKPGEFVRRTASGLSIGPEDPATVRRRERIATHACLHWNAQVARWDEYLRARGLPWSWITDAVVGATWRNCVELAEAEIDKADARHDERNDEMNSDRIYQAQREKGEA
jgi:hypothetical protein